MMYARGLVSLLIIVGLLVPEVARAEALPDIVHTEEPQDDPTPQGWDYLIPVGSLLGVNMAFWVANRYVLFADYSYINLDTMARNFRVGFEWDSDLFAINQIGHPYQGGLYHAGARAVGFGFWGSVPYTILGSLQWEMFMENHLPSMNDLITTSFGGVALGEALYRLASVILDDSTGGGERVAREGGALAISPILGLSRLMTGEVRAAGDLRLKRPVGFRLALGIDEFRPDDIDEGIPSLGLDARVRYGTFAPTTDGFHPFDWFRLNLGLDYNHGERFYAAEFDVTGLLYRWNFGCGADNNCALGPMLHFDYHDSPLFKVSTSSVGASVMGEFFLPFWSLQAYGSVDLGLIPLGGFDSPYADIVDRDYNLGSGAFMRGIAKLSKPNWFRLRAISSRYYVRTVHGAAGNDFAGITRLELEIPIYAGFGAALGGIFYDREELPDNYEPLTNRYLASQLQIVWRLN